MTHGTYSGYHNHGCRCQPCTAAHTAYLRARNHRIGRYLPRAVRNRMRREAAEARDNHGTETRYQLGCRCAACREASRLARARRRAKVVA